MFISLDDYPYSHATLLAHEDDYDYDVEVVGRFIGIVGPVANGWTSTVVRTIDQMDGGTDPMELIVFPSCRAAVQSLASHEL